MCLFYSKSLGQLHELHIGGNLLENLQSGVFTGMERLEKLFILSNNLREIDSEAFIGVPQLLWLALNNNLLTTLPHDVFEPVPKLQRMSVEPKHCDIYFSVDFCKDSCVCVPLTGNSTAITSCSSPRGLWSRWGISNTWIWSRIPGTAIAPSFIWRGKFDCGLFHCGNWTRKRVLRRSIPDGLTNTLIWYGTTNPSAAVPASSAVNLFTPWRLTTSATDSGRPWCNFYRKKFELIFYSFKSECFILWQVYQKSGSSQSPLRGSYKPLRRITLLAIPTYPHNLFHSLIKVNSTYQCMSTFMRSSTISCDVSNELDCLAVKLLQCLALILWSISQ